MKHLRDQAKSSMASKLAKFAGNTDVKRVQKGMPERDGSVGYATGGSVMDPDQTMDDAPAKPRLDRGAKKKAAKGEKGAVNVTIVMAPKADKAAPDMPPMPPPGAAMPPPMPPGPPPGGPPMPMRASGGRVGKSIVSKKGFQAGAGGALGRLEKAKAYGKK